ncbi:sulfite exporter TauE/SafE family protein 4 [Cinnamomum micranthum f. kanehirae]|uniref:Sulfite exporter TauE/SafE family protein 4 n=1 Tax=Cinnamomum micranthum f. kanehirae TaxID=337451 RepID=A0A443NSA8_9MAGN|nr:sulfite exporter TauE/SafE family protein 4 [Cinnamomum micranthum f. kanehirae]
MGTKGFLIYLLSAFLLAIFSLTFLSNPKHPSFSHTHVLTHSARVWPKLRFNWRTILMAVIGFMGSACGTVGGVGGGGIFVPMLNLIVGFDTKSAAALSKCMIMGASASSVWYNLRVAHPSKNVPIIDYDLALLFQPMLMLGITIGVALSVVFPYWLITVLIIVLFIGTSSRSFYKGMEMWKHETMVKKEMERRENLANCDRQAILDAEYEPLLPRVERSGLEIMRFNLRWKWLLVLMAVWTCFVLLQIFKNDTTLCSPLYWVLNTLQIPVGLFVFLYGAMKLHREEKRRKMSGNTEAVCEATIEWSSLHLLFCALCGIVGGTVGGLLGSGGGFILGPLLLEIGVTPQVASATATFVMMFSSSLSVVEFYFLKRFPIPFALYLTAVSVVAGFWGQFLIRKLVMLLKRASLIVFILSAVIFASALTMGVVGIEKSIRMIHEHEYMGFLGFCDE